MSANTGRCIRRVKRVFSRRQMGGAGVVFLLLVSVMVPVYGVVQANADHSPQYVQAVTCRMTWWRRQQTRRRQNLPHAKNTSQMITRQTVVSALARLQASPVTLNGFRTHFGQAELPFLKLSANFHITLLLRLIKRLEARTFWGCLPTCANSTVQQYHDLHHVSSPLSRQISHPIIRFLAFKAAGIR
jgi:hypothetical protein